MISPLFRLGAVVLSTALLALVLSTGARADGRLAEFLDKIAPADLVAGADRFGAPEGEPPLAPILQGDTLLGFVYLNSDMVDAAGYSGKPIHILVAIDSKGTLIGAKIVEHHEPIVLIGIPEEKISAVIAHFRGIDIRAIAAGTTEAPTPDIVSGATVTVLVIGDSILRSALKVVQARGFGQAPAAATPPVATTVDLGKSDLVDWQTLLGDGSVRRLHLSVADINDAYARSGNAEAAKRPEKGSPDSTFIDLYVAPVTIPTIGRSLLGDAEYSRMMQRLQPGQQAILVMGEGRYSFKGSGFVRGGIFDRIELVQGLESVRFHDKQHTRIGDLAAVGSPRFKEIALFAMPPGMRFDAAQPWHLKLLVQRAIGALEKAFLVFDLRYLPPDKYLKHEQPAVVVADKPSTDVPSESGAAPGPVGHLDAGPSPEAVAATEVPLWQRIWRDRWLDIGIVAIAILLLTAIFFFQDWFMRRPRLFVPLRLGFLAFVLIWLGWLVHAQPSVVNVLTYVNALMSGFKWDYFLMDPLLFILWSGIAAALLFWGRGPFCGWLCPFGALQELTNQAARRLKVPQITVPHLPRTVRRFSLFAGARRAAVGGRAVQDCDRASLHPRLAVCRLRHHPPCCRTLRRTFLLPLYLSARRRPGDSRPSQDVRLAQALPRVRQPVPAMRRRVPGPGHPPGGSDQRQRVHLLHALPTALLGRS
jgi:NosR/NirI family nitrous oxide reductase transcriptional regulator